jgi:nucleoside-diphosphate-sugar epimerase
VRNEFAARLLDAAGAEVRIGSVTDPALSRKALAGCDAVVNCALARGWPATARRQNEAIVRNIADAPDVRRVVHFSTVAVYGMCVDPHISTFERPRPDSSYGIDKLCLERLAVRLFSARGIRHHVVRLGHVYGPSQWVSRDVLQRLRDPAFVLPFGGANPSNAVSIEAVAAAVRGLLGDDQCSGIANLVDSPQSSWRAIFDLHARLLETHPVGSMSDGESLALRCRYNSVARQPLRDIARSLRGTLGSLNLVALAQVESFRRIVHAPLLWLPTAAGAALNRAYTRRKIRSALRPEVSRTLPPGLMCAPAVPGPCFSTIDSRQATDAMSRELKAWLLGLWSYRWDPAAFGLAADPASVPARAAAGPSGR